MTTTKRQLVQDFRMRGIREAARRVVARQGVGGATIEAIAAEAGIAKGTIYLYFKNRDDLLEQVIDNAFEEFLAECERLFDSVEDFEANLLFFVHSALAFFHEQRGFFRLYRAAGHDPADRSGVVRSTLYAEYFDRLHGWLRRAMDSGQARRLDVERVALVVTESLVALVRQRATESPPPPVETDTEWLASFFLHGLHVPRAASRAPRPAIGDHDEKHV